MLNKQHSINYSKTKNSPSGDGGVFLIGMMGSGKSHWCKKIAHQLNYTAYDLDELIEEYENKTIPEIFAEKGEEYFRKTESKILKQFAEKKSFVLATGGGAPCFYDNMQWMNENGLTVYFDRPVGMLAQRLKSGKTNRPLIKDLNDEELKNFLSKKLEERKPFYERAKIHWTGKGNVLNMIKEFNDNHGF